MTSINNSTFLKGEEEHKQQEQEGGVVGRHTRLAGGELVWGTPPGGEASNFLDVDWEAEYTNGKIWLLPFNRTPLFCSLIVTQSFNTFSSHDGHQMLAKTLVDAMTFFTF